MSGADSGAVGVAISQLLCLEAPLVASGTPLGRVKRGPCLTRTRFLETRKELARS